MSYLKQGLPEFNHLRHLALLYGDSKKKWTKEELKYYVAHLGVDGKADDWFFDSFLFISPKSGAGRDYLADVNLGKTMSGEGDFCPMCSPNPADKSDWDALLAYYFGEGGALQTLDNTISEIAGHVPLPTYKRNVVLSLPYPHITQEKFGRNGDSRETLNFSIKGQNLERATEARLGAEEWFVERVVELWHKGQYKHLNLLGLYWIFETIYRSWDVDDHVLLKELRKHINSNGLKFLWIPFYATYNFHLLEDYEKYYFDAAFLQPNFLFYKEGKYIETAATVARKCNAGIEMEYYLELDEPISIKDERHLRFREYLNAGVKYGYMTESACAHFQGVDSLQKMYSHTDPIEREFYEDIFHFVKGTYEVKDYPPLPPRPFFVPKKKAAIALDLGGTNLRMAVVDDTGKIAHWSEGDTPTSRDGIINWIIEKVGKGLIFAESMDLNVVGVGMSTGGRVNYEKGIIEDSTALIPDWRDVHIKQMLEARFNIPSVIDNDGNCAAVAEKVFGKAKSADNFISIALGTGIGGGIYVDGKLLRGESNYTSEIGHISVDSNGPKCSCGNYGCIELYASGSGLARWAEEELLMPLIVGAGGNRSSKGISESARLGNPLAIELLRRAGEKLGAAVVGLVNIFNPSMIIFSGRLVDVGVQYFESFRETLSKRGMRPAIDGVEIAFSSFPQEVGIIGAAALAFQSSIEDLSNSLNANRRIESLTMIEVGSHSRMKGISHE